MTYLKLVQHYESCFKKYGNCAKGVDWPNTEDLQTRFDVMTTAFINFPRPLHLLDLGCGPGLYYAYLKEKGYLKQGIFYTGIDLSAPMIKMAQALYPRVRFKTQDILKKPLLSNDYDFVVMNGVLTIKNDLSYRHMRDFAEKLISSAFQTARLGICFNVMNPYVDWCRLDLFHWDLDDLIPFVKSHLSNHYAMHANYGLHEFMIEVYHSPLFKNSR